MTAEDSFRAWFVERGQHFARAQDDLATRVHRFALDWSEEYRFRLERHDPGAVKSPDRAWGKCQKKGITADYDQLLTARPPAVGDLCRTRLVFRSRTDVEGFVSAVESRWPLGPASIEDFTFRASDTGYRAVHVNGFINVEVRDVALSVPYEVQVKTLAQDAWGNYTHDSSYVPSEFNQHPRWGQVRALQRLLADQLHVVDQLQQQIEVVGDDVTNDVARGADPDEVMLTNVRATIQDLYAVTCSIGEAQRLVWRAREHGVTTMAAFRDRVAPDRPAIGEVRASFEVARGHPPSELDVVAELLARP